MKPWFWDLVKLLINHPRQLPPICCLLKQPLTEQAIPHTPRVPELRCLVPRSSSFHDQGFSGKNRIAAPQRHSTRAIYTSKWPVFPCCYIEKQLVLGLPLQMTSVIFYGPCLKTKTDIPPLLKDIGQPLWMH